MQKSEILQSLLVVQNAVHGGAGLLPGGRKFGKILHPIGGQAVVFAARPAGSRAVLGSNQALAFQPQQQGIERALGYGGKAAVPQGSGDGVAR